MTSPSATGRLHRLIFSAPAAAALILLALADPSTSRFFPPCMFRAVTGWLCPGCGSARAIHAVMQGRLEAAWFANPLVVVVLPCLLVATYRSLVARQPLVPVTLPAIYVRAALLAVITFGIVRNIPN